MKIISNFTGPFSSNNPSLMIDDAFLTINNRNDNQTFIYDIKDEALLVVIKEDTDKSTTLTCLDVPYQLMNVNEIEVFKDGKLMNSYSVVYSSIGLKRKRIMDDNLNQNKKKKFWNLQEVVYPKYWVSQVKDCEVFDVNSGSEEYCDVLCDFLNELYYYDVKVVKLSRVQNLNLFKWYYLKKFDVQCKLAKINVEKVLYHGTSLNAIEGIVTGGLDNRLSKLTGANGAGVYFAKSPITSLHYLDMEAGKLKMLICKVITGRSEKGAKNLTRPPILRNSTERDRADSVKAELGHDKTITVYDTYQSYPEYIVEFDINKEKVNIPKQNKLNQGTSNSMTNTNQTKIDDQKKIIDGANQLNKSLNNIIPVGTIGNDMNASKILNTVCTNNYYNGQQGLYAGQMNNGYMYNGMINNAMINNGMNSFVNCNNNSGVNSNAMNNSCVNTINSSINSMNYNSSMNNNSTIYFNGNINAYNGLNKPIITN